MSSPTSAVTAPSFSDLSAFADVAASLPPTAIAVPVGVVPMQTALAPDEERSWRELALAERKLGLTERERRLSMDIREREERLSMEVDVHRNQMEVARLEGQKTESELKHTEAMREMSRKRTLAQLAVEIDETTLKRRALEVVIHRLSTALITAPTFQRSLAFERPLVDRFVEYGSFSTPEVAHRYVAMLWRRGQMAASVAANAAAPVAARPAPRPAVVVAAPPAAPAAPAAAP